MVILDITRRQTHLINLCAQLKIILTYMVLDALCLEKLILTDPRSLRLCEDQGIPGSFKEVPLSALIT